MAYFGGGGVKGNLHPSLRTYIDCFESPPFPKMFPRGGGIWDQDPILMRDFRTIREYELQWKQTQEQLERLKGESDPDRIQDIEENPGGGGSLDEALEQYLEDLGEDGYF